MRLFVVYFLTSVVFFSIDMLWLGVVAKDFYRKHLGDFLSDTVNWKAAIVFYLLNIIGIFIFAILPSVEKQSVVRALVLGALFGFFTYATYDLTNLATLKNWPIRVVIVDIAWGMVLTATVSGAGFFIMRWLNR